MYKVEVEFPSKEEAEYFMRWMDNLAEQHYFGYGDMRSFYSTVFHYDYEKLIIRGECIQESDNE